MRTTSAWTRLVFGAALVAGAACVAQGPPGQGPPGQGPPGRDQGNPPPGHGGVPPGQAKKQGGNVPPGQAKKYFREQDRPNYYSHYRKDADSWNGRQRPSFVVGQPIPRGYAVQPMPKSYWRDAPPPPEGYQYGYYGGYAVLYNPTTRIVADVMDLIGAATGR